MGGGFKMMRIPVNLSWMLLEIEHGLSIWLNEMDGEIKITKPLADLFLMLLVIEQEPSVGLRMMVGGSNRKKIVGKMMWLKRRIR